MTLFVPTEDTIFGYTTLEQSVVLQLKELEVKNPNMGTINELMKRIMEGPPGQDLDRSLIAGDDPLATRLSGGTSLLIMPASMEVRDLSVKDWLVDDAKEPDAEGGGGGAPEEDSKAKEKERLAKEEQDAKSFDVGQVMKARNEKEIELASLADKMQDTIAQAKEKLGDCSGVESEELMANSPSLVNIKELLSLRLKLVEACLPAARLGLHPVSIEDVRKEIGLEASGVKAVHVCAEMETLLSIGELGAKLQCMGEEATTGSQLATALKRFEDTMEPLRSLVQNLKTQKDRLGSARASAAKQHASSKQKQQLADSKEKVQPKAKAKGKRLAASGGSAIFEDIPKEFEVEITTLDYKDPAYKGKLTATVELGVPFIVVNSPNLHELQQSSLRLHFLVFRAGATANAQYAETGQVLQPLGATQVWKRNHRQHFATSFFGNGLQDLGGEVARRNSTRLSLLR